MQTSTISGTRLVGFGLLAIAIAVIAGTLIGPRLQEQVRQTTSPRTLREPIATGQSDVGQTWEAVAHYDGDANCVELRYKGEQLDRACDDLSSDDPIEAITLTQVPSGPVVAYGVATEGINSVNVVLEAGTNLLVPVKAGDLGFPVGFWATALPDGQLLHEVVPAADMAP